jgi:L-serine dehydratase
MRFKDVFSIIGPDMIGPSSSHTAGAVRIGRVARQLFASQPQQVEICLYRSFADTYLGHGTDVALAAGLLGWDTSCERIPEAISAAELQGMELNYISKSGNVPHPNTVTLTMVSDNFKLRVTGTSIGGGSIEIVEIDEFDVRFSGECQTVVVWHEDRVGMLADFTNLFSQRLLNIGSMDVDRKGRNGKALTIIEVDGNITQELIQALATIDGVACIRKIDLGEGGEGEAD